MAIPSTITYELGKLFSCSVLITSYDIFFAIYTHLNPTQCHFLFAATSHSLPSLRPLFLLDRTRPELLPDEIQKRFVQDIQKLQVPEVAKQLDDFR